MGAAGLCHQEGAEGWDFIPKSKETKVYEECARIKFKGAFSEDQSSKKMAW